ncbi:hypothetical protein GJAV_G00169110 [Gymnothorax javanicus]|nr:hypothetical protein GJAV_G00169110 [Gymnothorax javanicus]
MMYSCRGIRSWAVQRFISKGGMQIQVKGSRLKGNITCALRNHNKSPCNRQIYEDFNQKYSNLFILHGSSRNMENTLRSFTSWGPRSLIQAAHLEQLTGAIQRGTSCMSVSTSAQSSYQHRNRQDPTCPPFSGTTSDTFTRSLPRLNVFEPFSLTPGARRFGLAFPKTAIQMRASSTAAAQKREALPEDTAADLKTDPPQDGASGKDPAGPEPDEQKPNKTQQLKKVFKEYGAVGVGFHVTISLMSLGMFYAAISSGIDMAAILYKLGFSEAVVRSKMAAGTSTFVLAYAVHKLFAPVRMSITLVSVPLIVRYFRKTGLFKPPATPP